MKILQINNYHYLRGGAESVYLETTRLLRERGHDVSTFSVRDSDVVLNDEREYFIEPVSYLDAGPIRKARSIVRFVYSAEARNKLAALIKQARPDIAHLHIFYGRLTSSILPILKKFKIPTVMTVHEYKMLCPAYLMIDHNGAVCEKCANGNYLHCIANRCTKGKYTYSMLSAAEAFIRDRFFPYEAMIDRFIMVSEFIRNKHLQYRPSLRNKSVTIPNYIDCKNIPANYQRGEYYLYAGRLSREKGIMTLLAACHQLPMVQFKLAGDGDLKSHVRQYISNNDLRNVEMLGHLRGEELHREISGSKYLILPSEWYETFGLTIIEAYAWGKPIIAANIGGVPESVVHEKTGFLFKSRDVQSLIHAIRAAESLPKEKYIEMAIFARKYAESDHNKDSYYRALIQAYEIAMRGPTETEIGSCGKVR